MHVPRRATQPHDPNPDHKRFTRLSLGFSKKLENLEAAIAMFLAYYRFVWRMENRGKERSLSTSLRQLRQA